MQNYVIVTDSTTDLPCQLIEKMAVEVIPLKFIIDGKTYVNWPDERDLPSEEFYNLVNSGKPVTTAQINVAEFTESFEKILKQGKDILYIAFSSGLSGTYASSLIAIKELKEKYPEREIKAIDSLCASMGEGLLVYLATQKKEQGFSLLEVYNWIEQNKLKICHWFTVDDLNHLKRGGRVSGAAAFFGTVLGIKPVLHVDNAGHLIPKQKVRGRKTAILELVKKAKESAIDIHNNVVFVSQAHTKQDANFLVDQIRKELDPKEIILGNIGPVIGAHAGPGTLSIFFIAEHRGE